MTARRLRRLAIVLTMAATALAAWGSGARGAEEDALKVFGYITEASAAALAIEYNQPSFGVPATPTFEMRFSHSIADTDSGPRSHALSSSAWPGDLGGNAPPSLVFDSFLPHDLYAESEIEDEAFTAFRDGLVEAAEQFPPYPVRAETFFPGGPHARTNDVGAGVQMRASSAQRTAEAETTGSRAGFEGLFAAGHMNSSAFAGIRDGIAVAEATSEVQNLSLFGGIIQLKNFTNTQTLTSDGEKAVRTGSVQISGLVIDGVTVLGVGPGGPVLGDQTIPWEEVRRQLRLHVEPRGIIVRFVQPQVDEVAGASGTYRMAAVEIEMNSYAMAAFADRFPEPLRSIARNPGSSVAAPVYDALPGPVQGFLDSIVQFDQSITIKLGAVALQGAASPPFTIDVPPPPTDDGGLPPLPPVGSAPVVVPSNPPTPPAGSPPPVVGTGPATLVGVVGVPGILAGLALLLALAAAGALRLLADRATSPAAAASARCTLER